MSKETVRGKCESGKLKFSGFEKGKTEMFFSKSITFDEGEMTPNAPATRAASVGLSIEAAFIEQLKSGDAAAFDTFVVRYTNDIYALLYRLTEDAEEASDLTQETFLHSLKAIKNFRGEADLKTWLYRIAINESRNRFRWWTRRRREKTDSLDAPVGKGETPLSESLACDSGNPEQSVLQREREKALTEALRNLPEVFREAVILCDIEGLSYEEIAVALAVNIGTVKSRIARGREELRRKLADI